MIVTDTFSKFARRMSATQDFPYVVIAETPNPIRQLEHDALRARAGGEDPFVDLNVSRQLADVIIIAHAELGAGVFSQYFGGDDDFQRLRLIAMLCCGPIAIRRFW